MLSEQHRYYLKSIALYGLPLLPALYRVSWLIAETNDVKLFNILWRGLITYSIWLGAEFALLGRIPGFSPKMARGWAIAFYGLPLLPALYYVWPKLGTTTNGQDFFGFLGWFFSFTSPVWGWNTLCSRRFPYLRKQG